MKKIIKRILKRLRMQFGIFHIDLNYSPSNTVLIAGSGRSGTTWLSEILNYNNDYRSIFEPFYPRICNKTGFAINAVSGRVNDLKKANQVVEAEKRKCSVTCKTITPVTALRF